MIEERIKKIKQIIGDGNLIIVSKNRSIEEILNAYKLGHRDFGENKVQELLKKIWKATNGYKMAHDRSSSKK